MRRAIRVGAVVSVLAAAPWIIQGVEPLPHATTFAAEISRLSEPEGAFDTDNLISNEASYADVVATLAARHVSGGAYIGVGPDQNFTQPIDRTLTQASGERR